MLEKFFGPLVCGLIAWLVVGPLGSRVAAWMTYYLTNLRWWRSSNRLARPGTVFVCHVCGKRSHDRNGTLAIDDGWDASCRTWATLCVDSSLIFGNNERVAKAVAA